MTTTHNHIGRLAPTAEPFEQRWSRETLASILADAAQPAPRQRAWYGRTRGRTAALVAGAVVAVSAGAAAAVGGPGQAVKSAILDYASQPNTSVGDIGTIGDPELVAKFRTPNGLYAVWVATSSRGAVCTADTDGTWDGEGVPTKRQLEAGCGGMLVDPTAPGGVTELTSPAQLGGFFKDDDGPLVYGISPYAAAVQAHLQGPGLDRTLPIRSDSHGYGAALPEASRAEAITVTFLDEAGRPLGTKRWIAPVG